MIYLIKVEYKTQTLLKIGYTDDNNWKKRKNMYISHNPLCKILLTISGGTEEMEKAIHYKFRDLKWDEYGNEWFIEAKEIIDYLSSVTLEELEKLPINPVRFHSTNALRLKDRKIMILLDYILREGGKEEPKQEDFKDILQVVKLNSATPETIFNDLKASNHFPFLNLKIWDSLKSELYPPMSQKLEEFFSEYDKLIGWVDKIHYIVDYLLQNPDFLDEVVKNLPNSDKIKQQLIIIGPERIKGLGYNLTKINEAIEVSTFNKEKFIEDIFLEFSPGQKRSRAYIKEKLREIYTSSGYKGTPKAVDLLEWFELKDCKVNVNGKREQGFEIISKKP